MFSMYIFVSFINHNRYIIHGFDCRIEFELYYERDASLSTDSSRYYWVNIGAIRRRRRREQRFSTVLQNCGKLARHTKGKKKIVK